MTSYTAIEVMRPEVPKRLDGDAFAALESLLSARDGSAERAEVVLQRRRD